MTRSSLLVSFLLSGVAFAAARSHAADSDLDLARRLNQAFADVAEKVSPSVVVITVTQKAEPASLDAQPETEDSTNSTHDDLWRFFHRQFENEFPVQGQGSGIIIRTNGYILTNRHVVEDARDIQVRLHDGRTFKATLRGVDSQSDLAVIKIGAEDLPVARFADSTKTRVGEFAIAIGAPFMYDYSVTFGHVSAKSRSNVIPVFENGGSMDQDFIQTDANLNPGNSGGPLLNIDGEVIGINAVIRGLRTGIGFAIPGSLAREVSDELVATGKFPRPWLGISIRAWRDEPNYHSLTNGVSDGVVIKSILPDGPAAKSELQTGDIITAVDNHAVGTPQQLRNEVRGKKINQPVTLDVVRAGKSIKLKISPAEYVESQIVIVYPPTLRARPLPAPASTNSTELGITVVPLTRELATLFGVESGKGLLVAAVDHDSPAQRKGIKPGDVITEIGQQTVGTIEQFSEAVSKADLKKGVTVNLFNGNKSRLEILKEETP